MDDPVDRRDVQANDHSIAIGELNINAPVTGNITIGHTIIQAADAQLRHDLGILLKNVQTTWIKGVLERSVHEAALLDLGMEIREEAVDNPWRMMMEAPDQTRKELPRGKRIKDIFNEANGLLLILGEPGSGKTTTLLQLARDLISDIDQAFTLPVPVILNLSTWTNKEQPLNQWLVAELNSKYRVPKKDGQKWLEGRRILPLLDGLDEVKADNRTACVEKINQLVKDYGLPAVVCSRIQDYTALKVRLGFYRAIYIQPLTNEQVDEYLKSARDKLTSLRAVLQSDEVLLKMAQSPLILNIMSLAYQNSPAEGLSDSTLTTDEARHRHLFDTYIARMFSRKGSTRPYDNAQTRKYLCWLAWNMQRHHQEVFLIEGLQPSWISERHWQKIHSFIAGLSQGVSMVLLLSIWIILVAVISTGEIGSFRTILFYLGISLGVSLVAGIISGALSFLDIGFPPSWANVLGTELIKRTLQNQIQTVETLHWSWRRGITGGLLFCLLCNLPFWIFSIRVSMPQENLYFTLAIGLVISLIVGFILGIALGLSRGIVEIKSTPNEGIRLTERNAAFVGLVVSFAFGIAFGSLAGLMTRSLPVVLLTLSVGPLMGSQIAMIYGGIDIIQHYILRGILVNQGHTPRNYAHFLDYAVDRIFLQKVGGGYRFIHRLLLEHFAEMDELKKA